MLSPGVFLDFFTKILHCNRRFSTCVAKCTCRNTVRHTSCAMCIFLFLKFCNLIKRIMLIIIVFSKKPKTNVFTVLLLTCSNISNCNRFHVSLSKQVSEYSMEKQKKNCPNFLYTMYKAGRKSESFSYSFLVIFPSLVIQGMSSIILWTGLFL